MNVRELLQIEIWSKRTTRKILVGLVVVVLVGRLLEVLYTRWITPGEHKAGKAALAQIDLLQNYDRMSSTEFDTQELLAEKKVDIAKKAAWTFQDGQIAWILRDYLDATKLTRKLRADQKKKLLEVILQAQELNRTTLHEALD